VRAGTSGHLNIEEDRMDRRQMLGLMGAGAAGMLATGGGAAHADHEKGKHDEHIAMLGKCAKHCAEAASHCLHTLCKGEGDREAHAKSLEMAAGCKEFCTLTAGLLACNNPLKQYAFEGCAHACRDCATACEKAGGGSVMEECAKICRECAECCEKMCKEHAVSKAREAASQ
jgi:hypothetical protein